MPTRQEAELIAATVRGLIDKGRVVEGGWLAYRSLLPHNASLIQVRETRMAFYHGCSFMFQTLTRMLEDGREATDADMRRMDQINGELDAFERLVRTLYNQDIPQFSCPRCGAISHHATDIKEGYCGACHDWTR